MHAQRFFGEAPLRQQPGNLLWAAETLQQMSERPATIRWDDRLGMLSLAIAAEAWLIAFAIFVVAMGLAHWTAVDAWQRLLVHLATCPCLPALGSLLCGRDPLLRLVGVGIVRSDGQPAGRLRKTLREVVAWLPFTAMLSLVGWAVAAGSVQGELNDTYHLLEPLAAALCFLVALPPAAFLPLWAAAAFVEPSRGVAERLAGARIAFD